MRALRNVLASLSEGQNASLLLARYLKETKGEAEQEAGQKAREALFLSAQRALKDRDVLDLYKMAFESRQKALAEVSGVRTFKTKSRLIAGLGSSSVLVTGLTLNPLYGTPMIPGSSVKGIAAHYCSEVWGAADEAFRSPLVGERSKAAREAGRVYEVIFGKTGEEAEAGYLRFYDAWILPGSLSDSLCDDVMTPHHSDYYGDKNGSVAPTDFDDPNPVTYLSVKGEFEVRVGCVDPDPEVREAWQGLALKLIEEAFQYYGAGGKTRSGYGRMEAVLSAEEKAKKSAEYDAELRREQAQGSGMRFSEGDEVVARCESVDKKHGKSKFKLEDGKRASFEPALKVEKGAEVRARVKRVNLSNNDYTLEQL